MSFVPTGGGGGGGGGQSSIADVTLGADGDFDISGISQTFVDLYGVLIARANTAATSVNVNVRFNADGTATYGDQTAPASGTGAISGLEDNSQTSLQIAIIPGSTVAAGWFGTMQFWIPGYSSTSWRKQIYVLNGFTQAITTGGRSMRNYLGAWNSTAAINRIQISAGSIGSASTLAGSRLRLYGQS